MAPKRRREGGDDREKKKHWTPSNSKGPVIPENSRGFLVSCVTGKELLASREATELLGQYMEKEAPVTASKPAPAVGSDISALIAEEVAELKAPPASQLITWHKTNISGMLYLALNPSAGTTPTKLVRAMAEDIQATAQCKSRLCLRFIPVEHVCSASLESIKALAAKVVPAAFPPRDGEAAPETFAVQYEHRASTDLKRLDVINAFVDHMPKKGYKVSLDAARYTILVQLVKSCCTVAVVERYKELLKFNIRELSGAGEGAMQREAAKEAKGAAARKSAAGGEPFTAAGAPGEPETAAETAAETEPVVAAGAGVAAKLAAGEAAAAGKGAGAEGAVAPGDAAAAAAEAAADAAVAKPTPAAYGAAVMESCGDVA